MNFSMQKKIPSGEIPPVRRLAAPWDFPETARLARGNMNFAPAKTTFAPAKTTFAPAKTTFAPVKMTFAGVKTIFAPVKINFARVKSAWLTSITVCGENGAVAAPLGFGLGLFHKNQKTEKFFLAFSGERVIKGHDNFDGSGGCISSFFWPWFPRMKFHLWQGGCHVP